jgi:hypothetical protein
MPCTPVTIGTSAPRELRLFFNRLILEVNAGAMQGWFRDAKLQPPHNSYARLTIDHYLARSPPV